MLEHTFIHIQGIGPNTERMFWDRGIRTWDSFLSEKRTVLSPGRDQFIKEELEASVRHLDDIRFFSKRLSCGEIWRIYDAFKEKTVFLDIETSGGGQGYDEITLIGMYDAHKVQTFINGKNLEEFETAIADYDLMITFNGSIFDIPYIRRFFPCISLPPAHIDLRFLLKKLGYSGGLKKIEEDFGLERAPEIKGLNGYAAVMMWNSYQSGDQNALKRLIEYNTADIVNLEPLMEKAYREMKAKLLSPAC
ncbi:MAG: ribonuclease H-like domain-containing protein [Deltaproteobacteria bacterium]|nr:ribonuclease H-like domain-containing protein [Deltaproteobacteria bacterium]